MRQFQVIKSLEHGCAAHFHDTQSDAIEIHARLSMSSMLPTRPDAGEEALPNSKPLHIPLASGKRLDFGRWQIMDATGTSGW
mmetsp:Transcript_6953/g.10264  ORF Transcript_6953/g.10264 Transcript_6953/m.10264 type:complete len:82 (-) Transcript_6953:111-356(-)